MEAGWFKPVSHEWQKSSYLCEPQMKNSILRLQFQYPLLFTLKNITNYPLFAYPFISIYNVREGTR